MFDFFKGLFESWFGSDDDDEVSDFGGEEPVIWGPSSDGSLGDYGDLFDRLIDDTEAIPAVAEFVNDFFSLADAMSYVENTPETVLRIQLDAEDEVYHVYRFPSD